MESIVNKKDYEAPQITVFEFEVESSILKASGDDFNIDDNNDL